MMLPPDGKVVACDITDKFVKEIEGERYFKEVNHGFIFLEKYLPEKTSLFISISLSVVQTLL